MCATFSIGTALLIYVAARRQCGCSTIAAIAAFLFALNGFTIAWHSVVKTTAFADFFGLAGTVAVVEVMRRKSSYGLLSFVAGALLGIAVNIRLTHVVLVGASVMLITGFGAKRWKHCTRDSLVLIAGALTVSLGSVYLLATEPYTFYYHNVGFRLDWGIVTSPMPVAERILTFLRFVFYPQVFAIILLTGAGLWLIVRENTVAARFRRETVAWATYALVLTVMYVAISPTALQYFGQTLPFLVLASIPALDRLRHLLQRKWLAMSAAAVYVLAIMPFVWIFLFVPRAKDAPYRLQNVRETVAAITSHSAPRERVLSFSPHLPFLAMRPAEPGTEVRGIHVLTNVLERDRLVSRLLAREDLIDLVTTGIPALVVHEPDYFPELTDTLHRHYDLVDLRHGYMLFRRTAPIE